MESRAKDQESISYRSSRSDRPLECGTPFTSVGLAGQVKGNMFIAVLHFPLFQIDIAKELLFKADKSTWGGGKLSGCCWILVSGSHAGHLGSRHTLVFTSPS